MKVLRENLHAQGMHTLLVKPSCDLKSLPGRQFVAGVLAHAPALRALAAPTVNGYKRLTVGASLSGTSWAPATIAHGPNNRTAAAVCAALGEMLTQQFLHLKRDEWTAFARHVSRWELERYAAAF